MNRPLDTTKDSRSVIIANGASVALAVIGGSVWLASSPDLPHLAKLGVGLVISTVAFAFLALAIHHSTTTTGGKVVRFPAAA